MTATVAPPVAVAAELAGVPPLELLVLPPQPVATKAAATAAMPGATVRSVERDRDDDNPRVAYEVELTRPDGSSVEVELDANYKVLHLDRDHHTDRQDRDD